MAPNTFPLNNFRVRINVASVLAVLLLALPMILAACGGSGGNKSSGPHVLTVIAYVGGDYTQNMSPFSPSVNPGVQGLVYETLYFVNSINGQETPMLATSYKFNSDATQLTFTIRPNVKWSDGQPFTANDVAFTFNLLKQYPGADSNALWSYLESVQATDSQTVTLTFKKAYPPLLPYIEHTYIVPQHIWSSVGDPTKFTNTDPVGTGPFKLKSFKPQLIDYVRNPNFWQADKLKVDEVRYPTVKSNDTAILKMVSHQADWTGVFSPGLDKTYVAKDSAHNHYWMVPAVPNMIYLNLTKYPFNQLVVRQAISYALDRQQMSVAAESGYEPVASPTGLILPGQQAYLDPQYANVQFTQDPNKSIQLLQGAGFTKGSDGIFVDPHGNRMSYKINVPADWSDWVQICEIIQQNLKAVGIEVTVNKISFDDYAAARTSGNYDMFMGGAFFGATPYYFLDPLLNSARIGGASSTNWARWKDQQTDQLLHQYASTTDPEVQKQAIYGLEKIMVEQQPTVLLLESANWYEYNTVHFTGFPDKDNPYAVGSAYQAPDNEQVVLHLTPVS